MLRQTLARSALRTSKSSCQAPRTFATTTRRQAEVELTVGKTNWLYGLYGSKVY